MKNPHLGGTFDDFLKEEEIYEDVQAVAIKRVVAWQLAEFRKTEHLTKLAMAELLNTSRSGLDRLLDPENTSITLSSLSSAISATGKHLEIRITDDEEEEFQVALAG